MDRKHSPSTKRDTDREARLKAALKANLTRRKQQARARTDRDEKTTSSNKD